MPDERLGLAVVDARGPKGLDDLGGAPAVPGRQGHFGWGCGCVLWVCGFVCLGGWVWVWGGCVGCGIKQSSAKKMGKGRDRESRPHQGKRTGRSASMAAQNCAKAWREFWKGPGPRPGKACMKKRGADAFCFGPYCLSHFLTLGFLVLARQARRQPKPPSTAVTTTMCTTTTTSLLSTRYCAWWWWAWVDEGLAVVGGWKSVVAPLANRWSGFIMHAHPRVLGKPTPPTPPTQSTHPPTHNTNTHTTESASKKDRSPPFPSSRPPTCRSYSLSSSYPQHKATTSLVCVSERDEHEAVQVVPRHLRVGARGAQQAARERQNQGPSMPFASSSSPTHNPPVPPPPKPKTAAFLGLVPPGRHQRPVSFPPQPHFLPGRGSD